MRVAASEKHFSLQEYIQHELSSVTRNEYINGQLFEMPGEKDINNEVAGFLYILFITLLKPKGFYVYNHDVKLKIHGEDKYYYPDVFVTKEEKTEANQYIKSQPELIVEVVSESTQVNDYVDKFIDYTKIPSLKYYLIVEPETILITIYKRNSEGDWVTVKYTKLEDVVQLDHWNASFPLTQVYHV